MKDKNRKRVKNFLIFFGIVIFLPLLQDTFKPIKIKGLDGAFLNPDPPIFNIKNWNNSKFQQNASLYIKHNSSFRPDFVRISNQIDYWLFNEINTILTLGKENYIFDPNYIIARKGADYLTKGKREQKTIVLRKVKTYLDSLNIQILFCLAPNKANYYSNYLPEKTPKSATTNQAFFEKTFINEKLSYINFDQFFENSKEHAISPLMPKYGAHWSIYGAYLSALKMFEFINSFKKEKCVEITEESLTKSSKAQFTDDDYLASLNLIKRWKSPEMMYPKLSFTVAKRLNVLIISDSFFWNFYDLNIVQNCFSDSSEMWYYNKTKFNLKREKIGGRTNEIAYNDIKNRDLIIIMSSDPGLKDLGYGFLEQLAGLYEN